MKVLKMRGFVIVLLFGAVACDLAILPEPAAHTCGAEAAQTLIGRPFEAGQSVLNTGPIRVIGPGDAVTLDHRPSRLNVALDAAGSVIRVFCG